MSQRRGEIQFLKEREKEELENVIKNDGGINQKRNYAIYKIGLYCALRASEIGLIKESDLHKTRYGTTIYCKRLKGSLNNTILIIDPEIESALSEYLAVKDEIYGPSPYLFPSLGSHGKPISRKTLDKMIRRYCDNTSIPQDKRHMHVLKHTRAVNLGEAGAEIAEIQWWLGHKNINNTMVYAQFTINRQLGLYNKLKHYKPIGDFELWN